MKSWLLYKITHQHVKNYENAWINKIQCRHIQSAKGQSQVANGTFPDSWESNIEIVSSCSVYTLQQNSSKLHIATILSLEERVCTQQKYIKIENHI